MEMLQLYSYLMPPAIKLRDAVLCTLPIIITIRSHNFS